MTAVLSTIVPPAVAFAQKAPESRTSTAASERLRPPGTDPYSEPIDWSSLPPWKQTSFFGVRAKGGLFVFVVDCSGSMGDHGRLARAKGELRRTIAALRWPQRYHVIFYHDQPIPFPGGPASADPAARRHLSNWLSLIDADGGTDPRQALAQALALRPDAVFLLSDGAFPAETTQAAVQANPNRIPIHCIDLSGGAGGTQLRAIARESGGQYASRP